MFGALLFLAFPSYLCPDNVSASRGDTIVPKNASHKGRVKASSAPATTDLEIIEQAITGDERAFTQLFRRYQSVVFNYAMKICRDQAQAEEVFQDTFISVYRKLRQFDGRSKFSSWLYTIVSNHCLMRQRKRKMDARMESYDDIAVSEGPGTSPLPRAGSPSPAEHSLRRELHSFLWAAIAKLPAGYRVVFVLRDVEGHSTQETATILGISLDATKTRLRRARAFLRQELLPYVQS